MVSLNYAPEPTGIAPYSTKLATRLAAEGHEVKVLTGIPHYPEWKNCTGARYLRKIENIDGVSVLRLRHYIPRGGIGVKRLLLEFTFATQILTAPWGKHDLILSLSPSLLASAAVILRAKISRASSPIVVWTQDLYSKGATELEGTSWLLANGASLLEGLVLRHADRTVVIHPRFARFIRDFLKVPTAHICELRNWSHLETHLSDDVILSKKRYGWEGNTLVLHVGNMGQKQGLSSVIAAARLAQEQGLAIRFVLVGDGSQRQRLEREADGCPNVEIISPLPQGEFQTVLQCADILLVSELAGVKEMALPSKLTTYFSVGKPVIAAVEAEGITAEEVYAAEAGTVVAPGDPQALLVSVCDLSADPLTAAEYGANGRRYAEKILSAEAVWSGWNSLIEEFAIPKCQYHRPASTSLVGGEVGSRSA